jgi:hypothetical protein
MALLQGLWGRWLTLSRRAIAEPKKAHLAFLTVPSQGVLLLNLVIEGEFTRVQINREQLGGIVVVGARELLSTGGGR